MFFGIDIKKAIRRLLPHYLRSDFIVAWLNALLIPVWTQHFHFLAYRLDVNYRTAITPQVIYLEKMLNDKFDPLGIGIYLVDGTLQQNVYVFNHAEGVHEPYIYNYPEIDPNQDYVDYYAGTQVYYDYIVMVPAVLQFDLIYMTYILNYYKLASKRWAIQYY